MLPAASPCFSARCDNDGRKRCVTEGLYYLLPAPVNSLTPAVPPCSLRRSPAASLSFVILFRTLFPFSYFFTFTFIFFFIPHYLLFFSLSFRHFSDFHASLLSYFAFYYPFFFLFFAFDCLSSFLSRLLLFLLFFLSLSFFHFTLPPYRTSAELSLILSFLSFLSFLSPFLSLLCFLGSTSLSPPLLSLSIISFV